MAIEQTTAQATNLRPQAAPLTVSTGGKNVDQRKEAADSSDKASNPVSNGDVQQFVQELQNQNVERALTFIMDEKGGSAIIKVVDRHTEEVIRQIPSEEFMRVKDAVTSTIGLLFNESI